MSDPAAPPVPEILVRAVDHRTRPLDAAATAAMLIVCLSWGFNQVAVKLALPDIPPLIQAAIRSAGALFVIVAWARWRGTPLTARDGTLVAGLVAGVLFGLEFVMIYRGLLWTTASRAVIFIYTAPFFVAIGARLFLGEHISRMQWLGLALSFAGIAVAMGLPQADVDATILFGDLLALGAGLAWAATTLVIKGSVLTRVPAEKTLIYQLAGSLPVFAVAIMISGETLTRWPGAVPLGALAYQTLWVVGVTFMIWFALMRHYSASRLSAFTFLTPLFGVAAGHLVMGDAISPAFAAAVCLVTAGLVLVNRPVKPL